jgi:hypothetical protein
MKIQIKTLIWILLASVTENLIITNKINIIKWTIRANSTTNYQI